MAASSTTNFSIYCPCGCGIAVTATDKGFAATTVKVAACFGPAVIRKTAAYSLAIPASEIRHASGLVTFAA